MLSGSENRYFLKGEISQTSHLEKGWIENRDSRAAISYQDAFALNYDNYE